VRAGEVGEFLAGADKTKSVNRLLRKIQNLGFEVAGIRENEAVVASV